MTLTSFTVDDTVTDTDTDAVTDQDVTTATDDTGTETYADTTTSTGTEHLVVTGTGTAWAVTDDDAYAQTDTESDQLTDQTTGAAADGNPEADTEQYTDSSTGSDQEALHLAVFGTTAADGNPADDTAAVTALTLSATGADDFTEADSDAATETAAGGDTGNETVTGTAAGEDEYDLEVGGSDAAGYTVSETEDIPGETVTDGDTGGDTWNDPYSDDSSGLSGTEGGSDNYTDGDAGTDSVAVTTGGTIDAAGTFTLKNFNVREFGTVTGTGSDGGTDTVAVPGEADTDRYTDTSNTTDQYDIRLSEGADPSAATTTADHTVTGTFGDADTEADGWGTPGADGSGTETDATADADTATVTIHQDGTLDADGNPVPTAGQVQITGSDTSTENDHLDVREPEDGQEEDDDQTDAAGGVDTYTLKLTEQGGAVTGLQDDENLDDEIDNTMTLSPAAPGGPDSGSAELSGPVTADIHQTGSDQGEGLVLDPASGDDSVDLSGECRNTVVTDTDSRVEATPLFFGPYDPAAIDWFGTILLENDTVTFSDPSLSVEESDTDAAGVWSIDSFDLADNPTVTDTLTVVSAGTGIVKDAAVPVAGTDVLTTTESEREKVDGSGAGATASETATKVQTEVGNYGGAAANGDTASEAFNSRVSTTDVLQGGVGPGGQPAAGGMTDTTTTDVLATVDAKSQYATTPGHATTAWYWGKVTQHGVTTAAVAAAGPAVTALLGNQLISTRAGWTDAGPAGAATTATRSASTFREALVGGQPEERNSWYTDVKVSGTDPDTGDAVTPTAYTVDARTPFGPEVRDWFAAASDFSAAVADKVSFGLTKDVRQGLGYDDAVNYNSRAYKNGEVAGEVLSQVVQSVTPCRAVGLARAGLRVIHGVQAAGQAVDGVKALAQGDVAAGLLTLAGARSSLGAMRRSCFVAGTPLLTPGGAKPVEAFAAGDLLLSRNEHDPAAAVVASRVVETFVRVSPVLNLHVAGRIIGTTGEHPFWVDGKGWTPAGALRAGDVLVGHDGTHIPVDGVADSGRVETVYNLEVEGDHTYFVGCPAWGFDLWSHNYGTRGHPKLEDGNLKWGWNHIAARHHPGFPPHPTTGKGSLFAPGTTRKQIEDGAKTILQKGQRVSDAANTVQTFEKRMSVNGLSARYRLVVDSAAGNRVITMFPVLGRH